MSYRKYSFCILGVSGGVGKKEGTTYELAATSVSPIGSVAAVAPTSGTRSSTLLSVKEGKGGEGKGGEGRGGEGKGR